MRLIDADELYKRTAEWEEQAQDEVNKNKGCRTVEEWDKYKEWLIILNERSSFKYDIADAPTIEAEPVKHGRWEQVEVVHDRKDAKIQDWQQAKCSVCGRWHTTPFMYYLKLDNYCPNCGAKMDGEEK